MKGQQMHMRKYFYTADFMGYFLLEINSFFFTDTET